MNKSIFSILKESLTKKIFQYEGRSGRKEYIIFNILEFLVFTPLLIMEKKYGRTDLLTIVLTICLITYLIAYTSLSIRRLHDCNLKGWWYILNFLFSPLIFIVFLFLKGTPGKNKYGDPPEE